MTRSLGPASLWAASKKHKDNSRQTLAEGTQDARLYLHAGLISAALGSPEAAAQFSSAATALSGPSFPKNSHPTTSMGKNTRQILLAASGGDHFGFVAQEIGSLKVGALTYALKKGVKEDIALGSTGDFKLLQI
jgi:hypothetical protein